MDEFDRASEIEQANRDEAIARARTKQKTMFTGRCRYCNDVVDSGIFCNIHCATDYESEQVIKNRQYR